MGSHAITYAVVALAIAVACLFSGFAWGRSNVKAQIEEAVEKEHVALDAREFAMRTQLEDAIVEISKLRPVAEELSRVQKRLEREQAKSKQMRADFNAATGVSENFAEEDLDSASDQVPPSVSADEAIQKLMQSLDVFNAPNAAPTPAPEPEPTRPPVAPPPQAAPIAPPVPQPVSRPVPAAPPVPVAAPQPAVLAKAAEPQRPVAPPPLQAPARQAIPAEPRAPLQNLPGKPAPTAAPMPPPGSIPARPSSAGVPVKPASATVPARATPAEQPKSGQQQLDEWQEFARQLEALTGKKQ